MADISKVNVNSTDYDLKDQKSRGALVDVVDNGAKNLSQFNSGTAAADNVTLATGVPLVGHAGEVLVFSYETTLSSGIITVGFKDANGNATGSVEIGNVTKQKIVTIPEGTAKFNVFVSKAGTYTNFMVCTKAEWDISHTYVPYGKTNAELTTLEQQDRNGLLPVINKGSKNLLYSYKDTAISTDGIAVTYNADGSYTFVCTSVAENRIISLGQIVSVSSDTYTISGSTGGSSTTYMLGLYNTSSSAVKYQHTNVSEDYTGDVSGFTLRVRVIAGYSGTFTVYPMICTKGEYQIDPTFSEYRKDNEQLTADTDYLINTGVKNLLHFDAIGSGVSVYGKTYTHNGITYTLNADMTVTATGTADSANNSYAYLILDGSIAPIDDYADGKHIISGCPTNGSTSKYRMYLVRSGWGSLSETGRGAIIPDKGNYGGILIACFVSKGYAIPVGEPLVFKPMIRKATILDPTYELFSKTNADLTAEADYAVNTGVKNLLNLSGITPTVPSGLTLTDNNDGTFSVSGTLASANSISFPIDAISGNLILSGCPSGGGGSSYMLRLTKSGTAVSASTDTGSGSQIFSMDGTGYALGIRFAAGTYTNVTFKPMLRSASISDTSYQPYALPNPVITPALIEQVDGGAKNVLYYTKVGTSVESGSQYLSNGVRFTLRSDSGILVNRESSNANEAFCNLRIDSSSQFIDDFCNGQYVLSGSYGGCRLLATNNTYNAEDSDGSGVVLQDRGAQTSIWVQIRVAASASPNNVTVKPMICTKAAWDASHAYSPYALPNPTLTPAVIKAVDEGAKNLVAWDISTVRSLNPKATWTSDDTCVRGGITYKFNTDGTIVANGTADTSTSKYIRLKSNFSVTNGLIASCGLPAVSQDQSKGRFQLDYPTGSDLDVYDYEESKEVNRDGTVELYIAVSSGITVSNLVFRPMICTKAAWQISKTFQPYRPSWQEMDEKKLNRSEFCGLAPFIESSASTPFDLDTLKQEGRYRFASLVESRSLLHAPSTAIAGPWATSAGICTVEVVTMNVDNRYMQELTEVSFATTDYECAIYRRFWNGTVWGKWYKFTGTAVT